MIFVVEKALAMDNIATKPRGPSPPNLLVSVSFQFSGFPLTFLLHNIPAAKFGSRAGLGITSVQRGFYLSSDAVLRVAGDDTTASRGLP
ncbi:uncharacterized protein EI90DRAFT_3150651 [Cantharellus anzutake]|uniref:uncharacterized protein n=1 Tax=Cantharellus anzutake TaxID=1750568 RepID=UPI001905F56A|nr:uncharacterized protein EI90DRAFT_3150651 [Cantharellus anzutake]KAF8341588.1 hypothetical protein EI90DRAFT_3150651 [Cantharellus anzutake]